ncbi:MAG: hypothetical protein J5I93_08375 [Pirellulaceae bacterium]|nr:hypothetical protein [Pirellulaceae bacterium]
MGSIESPAYGPELTELVRPAEPPDLGPGRPDESLRPRLATLDSTSLVAPHALRQPRMAECCRAGLWLLHGFLDESHEISQRIHSTSGSYWHGIMHRREPDYENARYWFRRVGPHPVFARLGQSVGQLAHQLSSPPGWIRKLSEWDPFRFIDLCQAAASEGEPDADLLRQVAWLEWQLLFDYCYRRAIGAAGDDSPDAGDAQP